MVEPMTEVKSWDKVKKTHVSVPCPTIMKSFNSSMRGVDRSNMFPSLFRTNIMVKRWYVKMLFHLVDIAKVNAWLMYKRFCEQWGIPKRKMMPLLEFAIELSSSLINTGRTSVIRCWKDKKTQIGQVPVKRRQGRAFTIPTPDRESRYDHLGHWPEYRQSRRKYRFCPALVRVYCKKCEVALFIAKRVKWHGF